MPEHPKPKAILTGERVTLKARANDHAKEMFELIERNREHLRPWMPWEATTKSIRDSQMYLVRALGWWENGNTYDYSVYENATGKMIGAFGLHSLDWANKRCELGFWISSEAQGKGYITECVKLGEKTAVELGFHRLLLTCDRLNLRSQKVARRNGYRLEATLIDHALVNKQMRDTLQFVKLMNPAVQGHITANLPKGYSIKEVRPDEFRDLAGNFLDKIFDEKELVLRMRDVLSDQERSKLKVLNETFRYPYEQHLILMWEGKLAGWTCGYQDSRESFYMMNSAILPEHRGRGLYSRLLDATMEKVLDKGFQKIWSRHRMTNNSIIVPKLKRGFQITGTELSDLAGSLIHMTYLKNKTRQKVLEFRAGNLRPDQELRDIFKI